MILHDLSSNGTYVNGRRLTTGQKVFLSTGDELAFGQPPPGATRHPGLPTDDYRYIFKLRPPPQQQAASNNAATVEAHYHIKATLGKGTFATVKEAIDRNTGRRRAVKIINKARFSHNPKTLAMFQREVDILRQLTHPNLAQFVAYYEDHAKIYIVMEFVAGGDLLDHIMSRNGLPELDVRWLTLQICLAMKYTHSKGITHRDLKPENILLSPPSSTSSVPSSSSFTSTLDSSPSPSTDQIRLANPPDRFQAKVTDFGLAKMVDDQTFLRTMCGTPAYLAPEVVIQPTDRQTNQPQGYDQAVDSWSLGVIIYGMLTNESPFNENENEPLAQRVRNRFVDFNILRESGCSEMGPFLIDCRWSEKSRAHSCVQAWTLSKGYSRTTRSSECRARRHVCIHGCDPF